MAHHEEYMSWPFLTESEFDLACAFFDQKHIRAELGPTRKIFKIRARRTATTGTSYVEIVRLLQPPDDLSDLVFALSNFGGDHDTSHEASAMEIDEDADEEALRDHMEGDQKSEDDKPPAYSQYSQQPYVTYEIHLHQTYRMPTLWFTLHDLPMGEPAFDLDSVYRYLVPDEYKSQLRAAGITGGISAAPHPITDVPAFFIHPCQTKEAMESMDCAMEEYLMAWIGVVGGCVGLWMPPEMSLARGNRKWV